MRILHVIPSLAKGGAERIVLDICIHLSNLPNTEVKLLVLSEQDAYPDLSVKIDKMVCNSSVIPSLSGKHKVDIAEYEQCVDDFQPNIIHSHLFVADLVSRWNVRKNIKYFTHCHDNMPQFMKMNIKSCFSKKLITQLYERRLLLGLYKMQSYTNQFLAISEHTASYFKNNLPVYYKNQITLLHNAIDYDRFLNKDENLNPSGILRIINVGSFVPKKNQSLLVRIAKILAQKGISFQVAFLGHGAMRQEVESEALKMNMKDKFIFQGNVNNVEEYLWQSDVYVHTAYYEPLGLVLLEAMASGLPVVCLDGKGNQDLIEEGKNGYMISEPNPDEFADKIIELWNHQEKYREMSRYAIAFAKKYDIKEYVQKLVQIYKQA